MSRKEKGRCRERIHSAKESVLKKKKKKKLNEGRNGEMP